MTCTTMAVPSFSLRAGIGEHWSAAGRILRGLGDWQVPLPLTGTMIGLRLLSLTRDDLPDGSVAAIQQATDADPGQPLRNGGNPVQYRRGEDPVR